MLTTHVVEVRDDAVKVVGRPGFAAVYLSALAAHVIPRRAFASDQQLQDFIAMVRERMRSAKQATSA